MDAVWLPIVKISFYKDYIINFNIFSIILQKKLINKCIYYVLKWHQSYSLSYKFFMTSKVKLIVVFTFFLRKDTKTTTNYYKWITDWCMTINVIGHFNK